MVMPPDANSVSETRLYIGTITTQYEPNKDRKWWQLWKPKLVPVWLEQWTKTEQTPINFVFDLTHRDKLIGPGE